MNKKYNTEEERKAARAIINRRYYLKTRLTVNQQKELKAILAVINESRTLTQKIKQTQESGFSRMKQAINSMIQKLIAPVNIID